MTVLRAAAETHTGYVRSTNQDLAIVSGDLVAVADGMGGHLGGEVAARTAIEELLDSYLGERTADGLVTAARRANRAVWRKSRVDRKLHGMGTTLTAAALVTVEAGEHLILVNVGDSRAYVLDRVSRSLRQLTEDHSVVEEMVRQGELTPAEAAVHPHRHVLTRALGIESEVVLDVWDLEAPTGTRFLLCSDGLTNEVTDEEIADVLANAADPEQAVRELVGRALGHGGMDNVTVVVADVAEGGFDPAEVPELVPPRPPRPEAPVIGTPELTEAIPISGPPGGPAPGEAPEPPARGEPEGTEATPGGGLASGGRAMPADGLASGDPASGDLASGGRASGGPAAAGAAIEVAASAEAATNLSSGAGTRTTAALSSVDVLAAESAAGLSVPAEAAPGQPLRRKGRSMRVVQAPAPPAMHGVIDAGGLARAGPANARGANGTSEGARPASSSRAHDAGLHSRPVVLVPHQRQKIPRDRVVTFRVALFVLLLAGLLAGTAGTVVWFDQTSYFIGLHGNSVGIYEGRPGMLWFKPQLIETSPVTTSELLPSTIATLRGGIAEPSITAAEQVAARLKNEKAKALAAATTTTTSTTSTTTSTTVAHGAFPDATVSETTEPLQVTSTTQPPQVTSTTEPPPATSTTQPTNPTGTTQRTGTTKPGKPPHHSGMQPALSGSRAGRPMGGP
jgi:protein phosphatase